MDTDEGITTLKLLSEKEVAGASLAESIRATHVSMLAIAKRALDKFKLHRTANGLDSEDWLSTEQELFADSLR